MMQFLLAELDRANGAPLLIRGAGDAFSARLHPNNILNTIPLLHRRGSFR